MLDLSSFHDAISELEQMYAYAMSTAVKADPQLSSYMRTAIVKGFEYTYELAYKFMERFLDTYAPKRVSDEDLTFRELLRHSHEYGLISSVDPWLTYREKRNITSHSYNVAKANQILAVIPDFLKDARFTLDAMAQRQKEQR